MSANLLYICLSVAGFGIAHSLLASRKLKYWLRMRLGDALVDGWYRLFYNVVAVINLIPALYFSSRALSDAIIYQVPAPWAYLMLVLQLAALIGLFVSVSQTGAWAFMGVSQALAFLTGKDFVESESGLVKDGLYKFVRHPLYFFSLILIWASPVQTINSLVLATSFTMYFVVGSLFEEKRLIAAFGAEYIEYKDKTPWLLPIRLPFVSK